MIFLCYKKTFVKTDKGNYLESLDTEAFGEIHQQEWAIREINLFRSSLNLNAVSPYPQ